MVAFRIIDSRVVDRLPAPAETYGKRNMAADAAVDASITLTKMRICDIAQSQAVSSPAAAAS